MKLIETKGLCALLFDPGTGKTATVLDYLAVLALAQEQRVRVLVMVPLAGVDTWVDQCPTYLPDYLPVWSEILGGSILDKAQALAHRGGNPFRGSPEHGHLSKSLNIYSHLIDDPYEFFKNTQSGPSLQIEILNLDAMQSRKKVSRSVTLADKLANAVDKYSPEVGVVDESHKIKTPSSNVSLLANRISSKCKRRIILTGTLIPNSIEDIWAQWRFIDSSILGELHRFHTRYMYPHSHIPYKFVGSQNIDELNAILAKNSIVAHSSMDTPKFIDIKVNLSPKERLAYEQMKADMLAELDESSVSVENQLTKRMRLRQITSGYVPDDDGNIQILGNSKVDTIKSIVNDTLAGESRVVVFCQFSNEIDRLSKVLSNKDTEIRVITGDTNHDTRMKIRREFGSDSDTRIVLVAQVQTMSMSVNELVTASHVVYGSLTDKRDDYEQSIFRLNRTGQTRPVTVWHAVAPNTVDTVILKSHQDRTSLEKAMLDHIRDIKCR